MFHEKLAEARKARNMSQRQLAEAAGLSSGSVSAYEKGIKIPTVDSAGKIAAALGVSLDWLLNDAPIAEATKPAVGSVGDAARAFLVLVEAGVLEATQHERISRMESLLLDKAATAGQLADAVLRMTIDLEAESPMAKFIEGVYKLGMLVSDSTLDKDIYHTWLERELEKLDKIPLQKE